MIHLITPSLIGAIDWLHKCPASYKADAVVQLKNTLGRIYDAKKPDAMVLGQNFEDPLWREINNKTGQGSDHFKWFVEQCKGGSYQKKTSKKMIIDGQEYALYGKMDFCFPSIIKDVKTTKNYKGQASYLSSFQHVMYCRNEHIADFEYLIAEFSEDNKILDHHKVSYHVDDWSKLEQDVVDTIKKAVAFLKSSTELYNLFTTKYSLY